VFSIRDGSQIAWIKSTCGEANLFFEINRSGALAMEGSGAIACFQSVDDLNLMNDLAVPMDPKIPQKWHFCLRFLAV
jgi:hypothetical protein